MSYFDERYLNELTKAKNFEKETDLNSFKISVGCRELFYRKFNLF